MGFPSHRPLTGYWELDYDEAREHCAFHAEREAEEREQAEHDRAERERYQDEPLSVPLLPRRGGP